MEAENRNTEEHTVEVLTLLEAHQPLTMVASFYRKREWMSSVLLHTMPFLNLGKFFFLCLNRTSDGNKLLIQNTINTNIDIDIVININLPHVPKSCQHIFNES